MCKTYIVKERKKLFYLVVPSIVVLEFVSLFCLSGPLCSISSPLSPLSLHSLFDFSFLVVLLTLIGCFRLLVELLCRCSHC